eukprot:g1946.t1
MLLFPYLLRCYRLYFVFNYNIEQNENVRRSRFFSSNSPRRNAGGRSGRSSPVNSQFPSGTVRSSANPGPGRGGSLSPSRSPSKRRAKGRDGNMDDLAEIFYNDRSLSNSSQKDFFHKFSHRMSDSWLLQRFLILQSVFIIYGIVNQAMILQMPDSDYVRFNVCTHVHLGFVLEWELIEFVEQVIFVMALYKLWDVIDAFNISVSNSVLLFIVSVLIPLMNSYGISKTEVTLWSFPIALESLDTVLRDHLCMQVFQQYMTQSLAVQHVNFWLTVELYKDIHDGNMSDEYNAERLEEAQRIYAEYVNINASSPITILTISERVNIHNELKYGRAPLSLFDDAQRSIFKHMETAHFPKFLKSRLYRKLHQKLKIQQQMYGALKANNMINEI